MAKTAKKNLPDEENIVPVVTENEPSPNDAPPQQETMFEVPPQEAPAATQPESEPPKEEPTAKRLGRPRKEDTPPPTIIEVMRAYPSWEGRYAYIYRIEPYSNRRVGDNTVIMCKRYDRAIDEQDLLEDLGSGVYQIRVVYDDPGPGGERKMVAKANVRVLNVDFPPKIPRNEQVWEDPRNKDWLWAKELIEHKDAATVAKQVVQDSSASLFAPLLEMMKDQLQSTREELRAVRDNMNRRDPQQENLQTTMMMKLIEKMMTPPPPPPPPPPAPDLVAQLTATVALIDKMRGTPDKPKDATAELENIMKVQRQMEEQYGSRNGGRSRKTGWQEVISECTPPVAEALKPVFQIIAMGMAQAAQKGQQQANQQQQPPQQQPQPNAPPPMIQQPAAPPIHEPPTPGPQLVEKKPTLEAIAAEVLQHLQKEKTGYQLGDWYIEEFGEQEFKEVRVQGKPQLLLALKDTAEWRDIFKFSESGALDEILTEFFTWEPPDEEDEDDDEDEAPAANLDAINTGWTQPATVEAKQ